MNNVLALQMFEIIDLPSACFDSTVSCDSHASCPSAESKDVHTEVW